MAHKFDILNAVSFAYQKTWHERSYLLRLAMVPIIAKIFFYYIAALYVEPADIIKLSFYMLPAYFLEGWLIAHWVRTVMTEHRWPFVPSGNLSQDTDEIQRRSKGIMRGALAFVVVNFLMAGFFAFIFSYIPADFNPETADPKYAFFSLAVMVSMFFLFRFAWIYIPLCVGIRLNKYFDISQRAIFTFRLLGLWFACFVPIIIVMQVIGGIFAGMNGAGEISPAIQIILIVVRVIFDTLKNIIVTAGIAYALMEVLKWKKT